MPIFEYTLEDEFIIEDEQEDDSLVGSDEELDPEFIDEETPV